MTDTGRDPLSNIRLSDSERNAAVARIEAHARQGRLKPSEVVERSNAVRSAVTRGDLAPVFRDLPDDDDVEDARYPRYPASFPSPSAQGFETPLKPAFDADPPRTGQRGSTSVLIVSIAPFVALVLFFITAHFFGYAYAWLWFLLVPVTGILVYGGSGRGPDRDRDRDRRRDHD
ncbi:hypothetical protein B7R22_02785 [Subtercola boreus]|uniref:DUF1707 domain-containing protein n=1 Tax=Subtercola boreus TaxID=120213 RepID=A0A3E0W3W4_9MICO|nr:DUF1707 domain-containing protein [Subtercola boreus]RFA16429.1 hypothetical protein B7R22_02785 [Subtercola boreus]